MPAMYTVSVGYGRYSSTAVGEDTLELAHDRLIRLVEYYARLGHPIVDVRVIRTCDTCEGRGQIAMRRRDPATGRTAKPCKACDGQGGQTLLLI